MYQQNGTEKFTNEKEMAPPKKNEEVEKMTHFHNKIETNYPLITSPRRYEQSQSTILLVTSFTRHKCCKNYEN